MSPYRNLDGLSLSAARPIEVLAAVHASARRSILVARSEDARLRNEGYRDLIGVELSRQFKAVGFESDALVLVGDRIFRVAVGDEEPAIYVGISEFAEEYSVWKAAEWALQHGEMVDFNDR